MDQIHWAPGHMGTRQGMQPHHSILITGAHGFLGKHLTAYLQAEGYQNIITPRWQQAADTIARASPRYVFHLAGRVRGLGGNINNQAEGFAENARIGLDVVDACRQAEVTKVLAMGSGAVYPVRGEPNVETDVMEGVPHESEYGYAMAKRMLLAHLECSGLKYAYAVSCNLYGHGDHFNPATAHCIPSLVYKFYHDAEPVVWGDGSPIRDFLHVSDAARALVFMMDNCQGPVNMASGVHSSIKDVVRILEQHTGKTARYDASKPLGQAVRTYDISKLHRLDWAPAISLEDGVRSTFDAYAASLSANVTGADRPPLDSAA